jgi:hypothetical protein
MADRDDAISFLRTVMDDSTARMADRIKAAEAIVRAESATPTADGALHDLSDVELLARARGDQEGGIPPGEGPKAPRAGAVPSSVQGERPTRQPLLADSVPRETSTPLLARGPKEDPPAKGVPISTRNTHKAALERAVAKRKAEKTKMKSPNSTKGPDGTQNGPTDYIDPLS